LRQRSRHEYPPPLSVVSLTGAGRLVGSSRTACATATSGYSDNHPWRGLSDGVRATGGPNGTANDPNGAVGPVLAVDGEPRRRVPGAADQPQLVTIGESE
jgi:hypothetical protein